MLFNSISSISSSTSKVLLSLDINNNYSTELIMDDNQVHFFTYTIPGQKKNAVVVKYYFKP